MIDEALYCMSLISCTFFYNCCAPVLSEWFGYVTSQHAGPFLYGVRNFFLRNFCGMHVFNVLTRDIADESQLQPMESPVTAWLRCQLREGLQKVADDQYVFDLLTSCDVSFPRYIEEQQVFPLMEQISNRLEGESMIVREARDCVKTHIFMVLGKNMPERLVQGIQEFPFIPDIMQGMRGAGLTIPYNIDRETIPRLLKEIDDRCDEDDTAARSLEKVVKPFLDSLLEESIVAI